MAAQKARGFDGYSTQFGVNNQHSEQYWRQVCQYLEGGGFSEHHEVRDVAF